MNCKYNKDTFDIIYEAYYNWLKISWKDEKGTEYTLSKSKLEIRENPIIMPSALIYDVDQVYIQSETGALVIKTVGLRPDFIFEPCEEEE